MKWVIAEADQRLAFTLYEDAMRSGVRLIGPPLLLGEVSSALYKRFRSKSISASEATDALRQLGRLSIDSAAPRMLSLRAFEIAAQFELKWIYDAFYVALAEIVGCEMWTADASLHAAVTDVHTNVRLLENYGA